MSNSYINLARSWRSKTFDEVIGQELGVRLIKNSLFRNRLFPVYLLAGQRGCGKTTLGRVFAAAINCAQREAFMQQPREVVLPCLSCPSCLAMADRSHPDFHEIDAASHTGVDNIRELIEAASFLPGLGHKRVYLIDEAHMLSKAAFNAFLKILEEPPASVIFMLATTDPHKILETVRSRCFQLFLDPVKPDLLQKHLARMCTHENITYEPEALALIAQEADGSVRDAINKLEQIRLAYEIVSTDVVIKELGDMRYEDLVGLIETITFYSPSELIENLEKINLKQFSASRIWKKMIIALRTMIWSRNGVMRATGTLSEDQLARLGTCAQKIKHASLLRFLELWYKAEPLFAKTQAQHTLLESLFLRMAQKSDSETETNITNVNENTNQFTQTAPPKTNAANAKEEKDSIVFLKNTIDENIDTRTKIACKNQNNDNGKDNNPTKTQAILSVPSEWHAFLQSIKTKSDPLVFSLFKQGKFEKFESTFVHVVFDQQHGFFKELLDQTSLVWQTCLEDSFGPGAQLCLRFESQSEKKNEQSLHIKDTEIAALQTQRTQTRQNGQEKKYATAVSIPAQKIDLKDEQQWKNVHAVLRIFPGTVTEEQGNNYE